MASDRIEREQAMIAHDGIYWDHYDRVAGMDEADRVTLKNRTDMFT